MTKTLIPDAALDKHVALLGMTGAGKSSVIRAAIVEPDLDADRRVMIITPKDDYWGLRLSKNGKSKGYDIPIFGGWHGDYPLNVKDAALLAETYATMKGSAIFVTSRLSVQDRARWFAAFAETILSKNKGWARLVIDEAHVYMPKQGGKGGGAIPMALHAGNELVSQGRSLGLRIVLASQRSAKLHNDALTQCSCLMAMLLMAPHDRDAVKAWIEDQADPVKGHEIIASLANLKEGQAWVWAPRAKMLEKIQFPMPKTFDSSAAADEDSGDGPELTPINLDALKGKLATVEAEKKANDPKELKAEIAKARVELIALRQQVDNAASTPKTTPKQDRATAATVKKMRDALEVAMKFIMQINADGFFKAGGEAVDKAAIEKAITGATQRIEQMVATHIGIRDKQIDTIRKDAARLAERLKSVLDSGDDVHLSVEVRHNEPYTVAPVRQAPVRLPRPTGNGDASGTLEKPLQKIIDAIRWWNVMGVAVPKQPQVSFIAGYSHKSGTWSTYLSRLRSMQLIEGRGDLVLTSEGAALSNEPDAPPSGEQLRQVVIAKLHGPLARIMEPIIAVYPEGLTQEDAGQKAGYSHSSGTWSTYLSRLRSLELIDGRGELKAQEWLFP